MSVVGPPWRQLLAEARRRQWWAWLCPVTVAACVYRFPINRLETLIGVVLALALIAAVIRAPGPALIVLVALLPFQQLVLALLYRYGVSAPLVRSLGAWKEAIVMGLAVAAIHRAIVGRHRLDRYDRLALLYVAGVVAYLLLPELLSGPNAPTSVSARLLAFRATALFAVVFLAARHVAPIHLREAYGRTLLAVGVTLAALGLIEFFFSGAWNHFMVFVAQVPRYKAEIQGATVEPFDVLVRGSIGGREFIRVGSLFFGPGVAFYLLLPLGLALHRIARQAASPRLYVGAVVMVAALLLTLTRSAVLSLLVLGLVILARRPHTPSAGRARFALLLGVAVILAAPVVVSSALGERASGAVAGTDASSREHFTALGTSLAALVEHPLGLGLGTSPGEAERFGASASVTAENAYLEVGNEIGIPLMVVFIALLVAAVRGLRTAADLDGSAMAEWLRASGIALGIGGLFLHVWSFELAMTFWAGAALVLGPARAVAAPSADQPLASHSSM